MDTDKNCVGGRCSAGTHLMGKAEAGKEGEEVGFKV